MHKPKDKNHSLLVTLVVLLSANLFLTVAMVAVIILAAIGYSSESSDASQGESFQLPQNLATESGRDSVFYIMMDAYNSNDVEKLKSTFGKAFQLQLGTEFSEAVKQTRTLASRIDGGAYSHYEYKPMYPGTQVILYYTINCPEGLRTLELQYFVQGDDPPSLMGYRILS